MSMDRQPRRPVAASNAPGAASSAPPTPLDQGHMLAAVRSLPDQIDAAWAARTTLALPWSSNMFDHIVVLGMGGSAIGGDLAANALADHLPVPMVVVRDDRLPRWVTARTLIIGISVSGETAETLSAWSAALERGCAAVAITRGGELAARARAAGAQWILLPDGGPPRAALGHTFTRLVAILDHLQLVDGIGSMLDEAVGAMRALVAADGRADRSTHGSATLAVDESGATPAAIAARIAGSLPIVYVPAGLEAVGRRWKAQLNENAKIAAGYDCAPELHHNSVVPYAPPGDAVPAAPVHPTLLCPAGDKTMALTARLLDDFEQPYSTVRAPILRSRLAQALWLVQFGDLVSVHLAFQRGVDPTPIEAIGRIKALRTRG
ncbi:MAG: SIS domain-containing protein [Ardenticatenales bacterium]